MKLKYFKNVTSTSADFYIYGDIVDDSTDWWTGEKDAFNVDPNDLKNELEQLKGISDLYIYINSGGGSVFASSTMVSLLRRFKEQNNVTIHAYVDGLCASATTYILMVADNIYIYQNSIVMIHKPMTWSFGNADDLRKDIETLDNIENNLMLPMYMSKATVSEEEIKDLIAKETWFNGNENDDLFIGKYFNVNYLEESKQAVACSSMLFSNYKHTPKALQKEKPKAKEEPKQPKTVDYSYYENTLKTLKEV